MWKCANCGNESDGLFCPNCGAPMTEEGEKLDVQPVEQETPAYDNVTEAEPEETRPMRTFKDVVRDIVLSKMYLAAMILSIIGFAAPVVLNFIYALTNGTLSLNFSIPNLLIMISLIVTYQAAKRDFIVPTKFFSCMRASLIICVVLFVLAILLMLLMGLGVTVLANAPKEEAAEYLDLVFQNMTITNQATGQDITELAEETMASFMEAMGIENAGGHTLGSLIMEAIQVICVALWIVTAVCTAVFVLYIVVCVLLTKQLGNIENKVFIPTEQFKFRGFAITAIQVYAVLQIIGIVINTASNYLSVLANGLFLLNGLVAIGAAVSIFMMGAMVRRLNAEYAVVQAEEAAADV